MPITGHIVAHDFHHRCVFFTNAYNVLKYRQRHSGPHQTSMVEFVCKNCYYLLKKQLLFVNYFYNKAPQKMCGRVLNMPLTSLTNDIFAATVGSVWLHCLPFDCYMWPKISNWRYFWIFFEVYHGSWRIKILESYVMITLPCKDVFET